MSASKVKLQAANKRASDSLAIAADFASHVLKFLEGEEKLISIVSQLAEMVIGGAPTTDDVAQARIVLDGLEPLRRERNELRRELASLQEKIRQQQAAGFGGVPSRR